MKNRCHNFFILYPGYKNNRKKVDIDLTNQIKDIYLVLNYMGISVLNIPNIESDDIIGSIAKKLSDGYFNTIIITNDKDLNQLINENVFVYNDVKNKLFNMTKLGSGDISCINYNKFYLYCKKVTKKNKWMTVKGPKYL